MKHTPDNPNACPVCAPGRCEVARRRELRPKPVRKLTDGQRRVLTHALRGEAFDEGVSGRSEYGGLAVIVASCRHHGWLDQNYKITSVGREALLK